MKDLFQILPEEILREIISFIGMKEVCALSLVSKSLEKSTDYYFEKELLRVEINVGIFRIKKKVKKRIKKELKKLGSYRKKLAYFKEFHSENKIQKGLRLEDGTPIIKCVVIGDGAVGKTTICKTFAENKFPEDFTPTVYDNFRRTVPFRDGEVKIDVWDTAGAEEYDILRPLIYPDTNVFIIVYSLIDMTSLENVKMKWFPEIMNFFKNQNVAYVLVGTKADLREEPRIWRELSERGESMMSFENGEKVGKEIKASGHYCMSSRTMKGMNEVFQGAISAVLELEGEVFKRDSMCGLM